MKRVLIAGGLVAGISIVGLTSAAPAAAGEAVSDVRITYNVFDISSGADPQGVADAITAELYTGGTNIAGTACSPDAPPIVTPGNGVQVVVCDVEIGTEYTVGISDLDEDYFVSNVFCVSEAPQLQQEPIDDPGATFTAEFFGTSCTVSIVEKPVLYLDKVVVGGPLAATDFELEVYDGDGGSLIATVSDPSDEECVFFQSGWPENCAEVHLEPGTYFLGEVPESSYFATDVTCVSEFEFEEQFPASLGAIDHSSSDLDDTLCTITNEYVTQTVLADIVVINDDGGTATGADFTIEVFPAGGGAAIDSAVDPEPGTGNASAEFQLPVGDYTFGVDGPAGYEASAEVTVVDLTPTEIIDDPTANFTVAQFATANGVITVDDFQEAATTTTTSTTTPVAPTTTRPVGILPETGSGDSTLPIVLLALGLLAFGGGTVLATRRR